MTTEFPDREGSTQSSDTLAAPTGSGASTRSEQHVAGGDAATYLTALVQSQLENAVDAARRGLRIYESLRNLNEVIGTQYGDRVLHELIQNAHDAHGREDHGEIAIRLDVRSATVGTLYVANGGRGFDRDNLDAIRNLATSNKEIGAGIGNKGLGFRSVEALTDDVRIYSQLRARKAVRFNGFCFRFAGPADVGVLLETIDASTEIKQRVAETIPRYLLPVPLQEQPHDIIAFANAGYATVVVLPLHGEDRVNLAIAQVQSLAELEAPILLFLDRISTLKIEISLPQQPTARHILRRKQEIIASVDGLPNCSLHRVDLGEHRRFLVVRREIEKPRVLDSVQKSLAAVPQLRRWLDWKGEPTVSAAVSLDRRGVTAARFYNFLPMGETARAPLQGYLDAPFFADIDRRTANLSLPLNNLLITAVAEACAAAAVAIAEQNLPIPSEAVFDLVAWDATHAAKLESGFKQIGTDLRAAKVFPILRSPGEVGWARLSELTIWPSGKYFIFSAQSVGRLSGAAIAPPRLGEQRLKRLAELASAAGIFGGLSPKAEKIASWAEEFAHEFAKKTKSPRAWAGFYDDLRNAFSITGSSLGALAERKIFLDRAGRLQSAKSSEADGRSRIYVKSAQKQRARTPTDAPFPPSSLSRRFRFLDEKILLSQETLAAFLQAGLLALYDPVEALAGLRSVLSRNVSSERKREALHWAFQVWRAVGPRIREILEKAHLSVPTRAGWQPASNASFSASWTRTGSILEPYLIEAAEISNDCRRARDGLLVPLSEWFGGAHDSKREWTQFLEIIGVADGLRPVPAAISRRGMPSAVWQPLLWRGNPSEGFDDFWRKEAGSTTFAHPYTDYEIQGEAWRLPGQIEYENLANPTKESFSRLIWEYLKAHSDRHFHFRLGRFDRTKREWDAQVLPTPLAAFVKHRTWLPAMSKHEPIFMRPSECWASRVRRGGPPRFVTRLPEEYATDIIEDEKLAGLLFSNAVGVRNWQDEVNAVHRLVALASAAVDLLSSERPEFRREYRKAWLDAAVTNSKLPADLCVAVVRRGQLEVVNGGSQPLHDLIVAQDAQRFEARVLAESGRAVLEVGEASVDAIVNLIEASGAFTPIRLDGMRVQLLVDGAPFRPSTTDPALVSLGLEWLPDVAAVGHEILAEQLEKGILRTTLEARIRAIRVRRCAQISLLVDGETLETSAGTRCYAFEDAEMPTLILTSNVALDWGTLVEVADSLSRLIDTRLRSLETLLLRLHLSGRHEGLSGPSEEDLARALRCDVQTVQDHLLALRTDSSRVLRLLVPVVAYFGGIALARKLQADAERLGPRFSPLVWLERNLHSESRTVTEILDACEHSSNRNEVRRKLNVDYADFNLTLAELGEPILSNEPELRHSFNAYLLEMKVAVLDRLRRHYLADFQRSNSLEEYVARKSLSFIEFDESWIKSRELLDEETVKAHVERALTQVLGPDTSIALPSLSRVQDENRKRVQSFAEQGSTIVPAWCRKHERQLPPPWDENPQAVVRLLENKGLLDFLVIESPEIPLLCRRAGCWPDDMQDSIEPSVVGLTQEDLQLETKRQQNERTRLEILRRSVNFAGHVFDTAEPTFAQKLQETAEGFLADDSWFERSSHRVRLAHFENTELPGARVRDGKARSGRKSERQLTDAQRAAMGLASEWLAYRYLCRRHPDLLHEENWISTNRQKFFGGSEGDDSAGYDFIVTTRQAEWLYEVKSSLEDSGEFELTANEIRVASEATRDTRRRYRILYVPYVFSPNRWCVLELPNPMGERTRNQFQTVGRGSVRLRFIRQ